MVIFFFSATSKEFGRELWKSDGTEAGTTMVKDIKVGGEDGLYEISNMVVAQNKLFFLADDGSTALEIWVTDGTEAGTKLVKNISGNFFSYVYLLAPELIVYKTLKISHNRPRKPQKSPTCWAVSLTCARHYKTDISGNGEPHPLEQIA